MKMLKKGQKGFTLIELLIVVAIIGILAAIAIPQFAAYRQRAFNGSAQSDLRNVKTAEESLFADNNTYGRTQNADLGSVTGNAAGNLAILTGPLGAATATVAGAALTGDTAQGRIVGIGIALSNGVSVAAGTEGAAGAANATYTLYSKHTSGTRAFASEAESTGIFLVENQLWAGTAMTAAIPVRAGAPTIAQEFSTDVAAPTPGGGDPTPGWFLM